MTTVESKVVTSYEANVSGHQQQIELLRSHQQAFAAEVVKGLESQNKKLEDTISKWAKITVGIGTAVAAFKFAKVAVDEYHKSVELSDATVGVSLEGLRRAARGLKTDMELLAFAAKLNGGANKLNNEQLQIAIQAMEVYESRGFDAAEVTNTLTEALVKGEAEGLKKFGVALDQNLLKTDKSAAAMKALADDVKAAGVQTDAGADSVQRAAVQFSNATSDMKKSLGELSLAMTPVITGVAKLTAFVASGLGRFIGAAEAAVTTEQLIGEANALAYIRDIRAESGYLGNLGGLDDPRGGIQGFSSEAPNYFKLAENVGRMIELWNKKGGVVTFKKKPGAKREIDAARLGEAVDADAALILSQSLGSFASAPRVTGPGGGFGVDLSAALGKQSRTYDEVNHDRTQNRLAEMFGPIEQFDVYQTAFAGLTGAVTSAMDAWITGSIGAGQAIKRFLAEMLRGEAISLAIQALKHGAFAVGSIAFNDPKGAISHGIAAGKFAAAAAAAGIGAKILGAGGGSTAGGGSGAAPTNGAASTVSPTAGRTAPVIIAYGDDFADDSARKRAQNARRLVNRGLLEANGGTYS